MDSLVQPLSWMQDSNPPEIVCAWQSTCSGAFASQPSLPGVSEKPRIGGSPTVIRATQQKSPRVRLRDAAELAAKRLSSAGPQAAPKTRATPATFGVLGTTGGMAEIAVELEKARLDPRSGQGLDDIGRDRWWKQRVGAAQDVEHLGFDPREIPAWCRSRARRGAR